MRLHHLAFAAVALFVVGCGGSGDSAQSPRDDFPAGLRSTLAGRWTAPEALGGETIEFDAEGRVALGMSERLPTGLRFQLNDLSIYEARNSDGDRWFIILPTDDSPYLSLLAAGGSAGLFQRAPTPLGATPVNDDMVRSSAWSGRAIALQDGRVPSGAQRARLSVEPALAFTVDFEQSGDIKSLSNTSPVKAQMPAAGRQFRASYMTDADELTLTMFLSEDENCLFVFEESEAADTTIRAWIIVREYD